MLKIEYSGYWGPDDTRSQGIDSHGIDLAPPDYQFQLQKLLTCGLVTTL